MGCVIPELIEKNKKIKKYTLCFMQRKYKTAYPRKGIETYVLLFLPNEYFNQQHEY
jgi:hypothetical protein